MQHQYWVTKKCVLQKFGGKEDECIVSSDAELDAKLELFRSVADTCLQLQRAIDIYQERICNLAQEENTLGRYLKEAGKNEKNNNAGQLMMTAGKALAYSGHQRLTLRSPLIRLHHEVETFRGRAISDSKATIMEMEKARTEYRAALSWMKAASQQLDPDTGQGLDRFRKAQSQVRSSKVRFDRLMLACLQKVDLLAAARCNMFSHALVLYQNALSTFAKKASDTLKVALTCLEADQPLDICTVSELTVDKEKESHDKDQKTFFNADYTDDKNKERNKKKKVNGTSSTEKIIDFSKTDDDDSLLMGDLNGSTLTEKDSDLLDLSWQTGPDSTNNKSSNDLLGDFLPSHLLQFDQFQSFEMQNNSENGSTNVNSKAGTSMNNDNNKSSAVSWLSLFADLDPLANNNDGSI